MAEQERGEVRTVSGLTHAAPPEELRMNKYHMLWVLRCYQDESKTTPRGEWILIPATTFIALMLALLTSSFKDAFNVGRETWEAVAILSAALTAAATVVLFVWWIVARISHPAKRPEQIVEQIIVDMAKDREKALKSAG